MVTTIVLTCRSKGEDFQIHYAALDSPVVRMFVDLLECPPGYKVPYGSSLVVPSAAAANLTEQSRKVLDLVNSLAGQYGELFDRTNWTSPLDQQALNALHNGFEKFERSWSACASQSVRDGFAELNRQIHLTEGLLDAQSGAVADSKTFFSAHPDPARTARLSDSHYALMDIQLRPGRLYMGYYTVGKNFLSIWRQNDLALVRAKHVSPQTHANTQIVGIFAPPGTVIASDEMIKDGFWGWWQANRITETYGYDPSDASTLALGWFPLGELKPSSIAPWPLLADAFEVISLHYV